MKKQKGITLIALVVTIVVLLILSGIALNLVLGDNGIITRTKEAKLEDAKSKEKEQIAMALQDYYIGKELDLSNIPAIITTADGKQYEVKIAEDGSIMVGDYTAEELGITEIRVNGTEDDCFTWTVNGSEATITGLTDKGKQLSIISIPSTYTYEGEDKTVTSIGDRAFMSNTMVKSVIIQDGVTTIGKLAFYGCKNLSSLNMADSITSIGTRCFEACSSLQDIKLSRNLSAILDSRTFSGCNSLTSITIPENMTSIYSEAFVGCNGLKEINVDENNPNYKSQDGILFNKEMTKILYFPIGKSDDKYIIPNNITEIGPDAFYGCKNLQEVVINDNITSISNRCFCNCSGLKTVNITNNITTIELGAFYGCTSMESINIPSSVTTMQGSVFTGCSNLTITIDKTEDECSGFTSGWNGSCPVTYKVNS